jgi:hypothetical protein
VIYHNNILCVSGRELIRSEENPNGLINLSLWKKWVRDGARLVQKGGNGRVSLIEFDTLPPKYKALITEREGDPREKAIVTSFKSYVLMDDAAKAFFAGYQLESGDHLPEIHQKHYLANANVLNAVKLIYTNQIRARKSLGGNIRDFWEKHVGLSNSVREEFDHKLPSSKSQFKRVYDDYIKDGYESLVSKKFCNKNTEKITPEIEDWIITEMAMTRQSIEMLFMRYKAVAIEKQWRTDIEASAFRHRISQPSLRQMIDLKRYGVKQFRKLNGQSFKLKRAKYSNDIWVSDGTAINWYYREDNKVAMATTYMVMDGSSNKWLGWSTKKGINKENFEMQLEAYRMAIRNSGAKPFQLLYDNQGGHKMTESREFYSALSKVHFPTRAYRPSGKPIEQAFGDFQRLKLSEFPFWSGFSRESHSDPRFRPNYEAIKKNIDDLPNFEELNVLFDKIVNEWNDLNFNGKGSPNELYAKNRNPEEKAICIDEMAELFWNMGGERKYNAPGIIVRVAGEEILYEVYTEDGDVDYEFRKRYLHQKFHVKYDPDGEFKEVELYQKHATGGYQKIANALPKREVSRVVKDLNPGDKEWINKQMELEGQYIEELESQIVEKGYDEEIKWSAWRKKIEEAKPVLDDNDDDEDIYAMVLNKM